MKQKPIFWIGIAILLILAITYLIEIPIDSGSNYVTVTPLLGMLIFYNPFILGIYILVAALLIIKGRK